MNSLSQSWSYSSTDHSAVMMMAIQARPKEIQQESQDGNRELFLANCVISKLTSIIFTSVPIATQSHTVITSIEVQTRKMRPDGKKH